MQLSIALRAVLILLGATPTIADNLPSNHTSLLWGPYRSNLYFGVRPRLPENILLGLMWGSLGAKERHVRHDCSQNDGMAGYGWTTYDARRGGTQVIHDVENKVDLTTEFVKIHEGDNAGNWGLRVRGEPRADASPELKTSVVFYIGVEAVGKCPECHVSSIPHEREQVDIQLEHPRLRKARICISKPRDSETDVGRSNSGNIYVRSFNVTSDDIWRAKSIFVDVTKDGSTPFIPSGPGTGNLQMVQIVSSGKFEFEILYSSQPDTHELTKSELSQELSVIDDSFHKKFQSVFPPASSFTNMTTFGEQLIANLFGGLSYFHGEVKVDDSNDPAFNETTANFWVIAQEAQRRSQPKAKGPYELFTHVPSRPFFPRGFLWDEGFHLLAVAEWDLDLAIDVVRSWLSLMNADGWIAREQILGNESRSKVPEAFQVQYPHIANPPTLFWVVEKVIKILSGDTPYHGHTSIYLLRSETGADLLKKMFPLLVRHYRWFLRTQSGDITDGSPYDTSIEGYRWRGRTPGYAFASGLDDYPRAEPPDTSELHVDALCWVGVMSSVLAKLAQQIDDGESSIRRTYLSRYERVANSLDVVHWSATDNTYCDTRILQSTYAHFCTRGYISIFPLLTGFIGPNSPTLNATLNLIRDPNHLWSPYGIRSLGLESEQYGSRDNYWRSPIWININYLIIKQLLDLANKEGPYQTRCRSLYAELRINVVNTIYKSWKDTGFAWEQYNPSTGQGQRTQHFTGWTALVVLIMAMPDLKDRTGHPKGLEDGIDRIIGGARGSPGWSTIYLFFTVMVFVVLYWTRRRSAKLLRSLRNSMGG